MNFRIDFGGTRFLDSSFTAARPDRLNWRCEIILTRNSAQLEGRRVLDLAAHDGRFSWAALQLGAKFVQGVEARQHLVENSIENMAAEGFGAEKYACSQGDVFEYLAGVEEGAFDTILCLGYLYHTTRHEELFAQVNRIGAKHLILDTEVDNGIPRRVARLRASKAFRKADELLAKEGESLADFLDFCEQRPYAWFSREDITKEWTTADPSGLVAHPSRNCLELMLGACFDEFRQLDWHADGIENWDDMEHYGEGARVSYVGTNLRGTTASRPVQNLEFVHHFDRAARLARKGQHEAAVEAARKTPPEDPKHYQSKIVCADSLIALGQYGEAEAEVAAALALASERPDAYVRRAWVRWHQERVEEGLADIAEAERRVAQLEAPPPLIVDQVQRAKAALLERAGQLKEALALVMRSLELRPDHAPLLERRDRLEKAIRQQR